MASKNKKEKEPCVDKNIFNMVRDYCKEPWVSTNKELPIQNKFVLLAYYAGEDTGYRMAVGWLHKQPIKEKDDEKKENTSDWFLTPQCSYYTRTIDVNDSENNNYRRSKYMDYHEWNWDKKEDELTSTYEVIEENGEKFALIWFVFATGDSPGIFRNVKSANSTYSPELYEEPLKAAYSNPDFWMYVPEIK